MDEQYVGKRFKLFKSARDTKVFYVIGAFLCLIVVLHHFDSVIKCCFQKIVNLKQSIDYVKDVSYNYLSSLYYDFSGKSGKIIFRQRNEICRLKAEISRANLIQQENQELRKLLKVKEGSFANIVIAKVISVFDNDIHGYRTVAVIVKIDIIITGPKSFMIFYIFEIDLVFNAIIQIFRALIHFIGNYGTVTKLYYS